METSVKAAYGGSHSLNGSLWIDQLAAGNLIMAESTPKRSMSRRQYLSRSANFTGSLAAGLTILCDPRSVQATPANDRIELALIGCGDRSGDLLTGFGGRKDCHFRYLVDPDSTRFESHLKHLSGLTNSAAPQCLSDFRKALDDSEVDAVVIATPDHWHAPITIQACLSGKDVYVEKPMSHNGVEGQLMVQAARRGQRVVQVGTQNRSAAYNMAARHYIADGKLGQIHLCRVFNQKYRPPIVADASTRLPSGLNWDLWSGPAALVPYDSTRHRSWNSFWDYSGGDIVNDAIHQIDLARWICGLELPTSVSSVGGQYARQDAAETPDTQHATFQYDSMLMTFDLTLWSPYMLKSDSVLRDSDLFPHWPQNSTRIEIYGTKGMMLVGRMGGGWQVFDRPRNRRPVVAAQQYGRFADAAHQQNFIDCMRSRQRPNADVEIANQSMLLAHFANISLRLGGRQLEIDPRTAEITEDKEAMALFRRAEYREPWGLKTNSESRTQ